MSRYTCVAYDTASTRMMWCGTSHGTESRAFKHVEEIKRRFPVLGTGGWRVVGRMRP